MLLRRTYGIDTGTSTVKIYAHHKNKFYLEKNMIAVKDNGRVLAVGDEAYDMFEKTPENIEVDSPMAFGMIADVSKQEFLLYTLLKKIDRGLSLGSIMYFAVPMDLSQIEKRAYDKIANGGRLQNNKIYMVEKPIADAIALDISINKTKGSMVVNIGAQSTEISVISEGKVIISKMIPVGGRQMNLAICDEVRKEYKLQIGSRTGRRLKLVMGDMGRRRNEARKVFGIDSLSGLPREEVITSRVVNDALCQPLDTIGEEIKIFLERTPPQIAYQILKEGIYLTGGSTHLPAIDRYLADYVGYGISLSQLYERCTVTGLSMIIKDKYLQKWAAPIKQRKL